MARPSPAHSPSITLRHWLPVIIGIVALYVIVPQLTLFRHSLEAARNADYGLLLLAGAAIGVTFMFGAAVYVALAYRQLKYGRSVVAQLAANFFNRILPAGVGGIGANYRYLRQQRHTSAQAASVVAANNGLGIIGHLLLLVTLLALFHSRMTPIHGSTRPVVVGLLLIVVVAGAAIAIAPIRRKLSASLSSFRKQLLRYQSRPAALALALSLQLCLTVSNVMAFWLCALALHISLTFVGALLIFTFGFGIGTAVPTPGGLGGVEAGLVAGLVAYHQTSSVALAAVLIYRLISYWLPLLISAPICLYASRHHYFAD